MFTQLCMAFATIRDQVGSLESKRLKGGMTFPDLGWFLGREGTDDLFCMYFSSDFDMSGQRSGELEVAVTQTKTQRKPDNPNITKGP